MINRRSFITGLKGTKLNNNEIISNSKDKIYFNTISDLSYSDIDLEYHPVSKAINNPFNNNPELLNPIDVKKTINLFT